ncbi:MAG TPA: c-type cytochrome [Candidatus Sulfotelmatobacter sp.]|nr:c-type cytochrome [Candidatus Sulfotelmatobacter sp.]
MFSAGNSRRLLIALTLLCCAGILSACSLQAQDDSQEDDFKSGPPPGQRTFTATCAGCHGLDGRGSEKGPNIAGNPKVQHLSAAQLSAIIANGVPGTGMPAFRSLSPAQVRSLVSYLHILQGKLASRTLTGDPTRGRNLFFGKGECSTCHTISGEGGFIGPDLTAFAASMSADSILKAILNPVRIVPAGYKSAAVTTRDGNRVEGVIRNEDNFSLQLQTTDGSFHFFQKSELQNVEYLSRSSMPSNYSERLSQTELDDLTSFLMGAGSPSKASESNKQ